MPFFPLALAALLAVACALPTAVDESLRALADSDLELKSFYKAMESHDFKKASGIYDKLSGNLSKLKTESKKLLSVSMKEQPGERFVRLAEVQMKILLEKMGAVINSDAEERGENKDKKDVKKKSPERREENDNALYAHRVLRGGPTLTTL